MHPKEARGWGYGRWAGGKSVDAVLLGADRRSRWVASGSTRRIVHEEEAAVPAAGVGGGVVLIIVGKEEGLAIGEG